MGSEFLSAKTNWGKHAVHYVFTVMSTFVSSQELDSMAHVADPCFRPYEGHNAFREKYFCGVNKRCGKQDNKSEVSGE